MALTLSTPGWCCFIMWYFRKWLTQTLDEHSNYWWIWGRIKYVHGFVVFLFIVAISSATWVYILHDYFTALVPVNPPYRIWVKLPITESQWHSYAHTVCNIAALHPTSSAPSCIDISWRSTSLSQPKKLISSTAKKTPLKSANLPWPLDLTISVKAVFVTRVSGPGYRLSLKTPQGVTAECPAVVLHSVVVVTSSTFSNLYFTKEWWTFEFFWNYLNQCDMLMIFTNCVLNIYEIIFLSLYQYWFCWCVA